MKTRSRIAVAALAGLAVCAAQARSQLAPLLRAHKYAEVERIADADLARYPLDADALIAKADAIAALDPDGRAGKPRARALAAQTGAVNPAAARLMRAQLALADKDEAQAEAILLAVQPGSDEMVADRQRDLLAALGQRYQAAGKHADSERILHILRQRFPASD
jgi:hypothetical protein